MSVAGAVAREAGIAATREPAAQADPGQPAMSLRRPINLLGLGAGAAFGVLLVLSGFSDPLIVHKMLLLQDPTLYLMFASVMATAVPLLWLLERKRWRTPLGGPIEIERVPVQRRHILGALTFGCGWAVAGTCPGPMLAMTVGGHVLGAVVMTGLVGGLLLRERVKTRFTSGQTSPPRSARPLP